MKNTHTLKERRAAHWFKLGRYWMQASSQAENKGEFDTYIQRAARAYCKAYENDPEPWKLI
jgi:hypothetical protein